MQSIAIGKVYYVQHGNQLQFFPQLFHPFDCLNEAVTTPLSLRIAFRVKEV